MAGRHDANITAAPDPFRGLLSQLRMQLAQALPGAEEVVKYDMPAFQIEGTIVAGYAAFSKQCGLYVDPGAIAAHADEIAALKLKATKWCPSSRCGTRSLANWLKNWRSVRAIGSGSSCSLFGKLRRDLVGGSRNRGDIVAGRNGISGGDRRQQRKGSDGGALVPEHGPGACGVGILYCVPETS